MTHKTTYATETDQKGWVVLHCKTLQLCG